MSMEYNWKCSVCTYTNEAGTDHCIKCRSAAQLSSVEIAERKKALSEGVAFDDRGQEVLEARTKHGKLVAWAVHVSMGNNKKARAMGNIVFYAVVLMSFLSLSLRIVDPEPFDFDYIVLAAASVLLGLEIRNFCTGKTTYLDRLVTPAVRTNTFIRWLGLVFDIFFLYIVLTITKT